MTFARASLWLLALAPACYRPDFGHVACGPGDACPDGKACNHATGLCEAREPDAGSDASLPDAAPGTDGPIADARLCFGAGLVNVCLAGVPTSAITFVGNRSIDTSTVGNCPQTMLQPGGPDLCIIAGTTVMVSGTLIATGSRALVLIASDSLTISGTLDVSSAINTSPRRGAGANTGACANPAVADSDTGGAGGGAGGSLATRGGNGGAGDLNNNGNPAGTARGGVAGNAQPAPTMLRGGCHGGDGGSADGQHRGRGGDGGGAVYLLAGNAIHIIGDVFASGSGGTVDVGTNGIEEGGGGGGAGGMIGVDAPSIDISGHVAANGGAGGGGGGLNGGGTPGGDGSTTNWNVQASSGAGGSGGGDGARGTAVNASANIDGANSDGGGGGGGGGLGIVWIDGTASGGTMISPAPTPH